MTKKLKLGLIFFITVFLFIVLRIVAQYLPLSDNWLSWVFSFLNQVINLCVLPIVLYRLLVSKDGSEFKKDFRLKSILSAKVWILTGCVAFLLYFTTLGVAVVNNVILQLFGYKTGNSVGTIYSSGIVLVMEIITSAMFPAFCEEFADRGLLLAVLDGEKSDNKKIVILAIMFGLLHQNIMQFGYAIFGGFVMGYLAIKTKSLFPGMLVHFTNNFIGILVEYSSQKGGALGLAYEKMFAFVNSYFIVMVLIWIASGTLLVYLLKVIGKTCKEEEKAEPDWSVVPSATIKASVQNLFGFQPPTDESQTLPDFKPTMRRREYVFLYATIVMTALTTLFTFLWGLLR